VSPSSTVSGALVTRQNYGAFTDQLKVWRFPGQSRERLGLDSN
jgi:hypothetical protein